MITMIMDEDKWTERSNEIRAWLEHNDAGAMNALIEQTLNAGDAANSDDERNRFWEAVRAICRAMTQTN